MTEKFFQDEMLDPNTNQPKKEYSNQPDIIPSKPVDPSEIILYGNTNLGYKGSEVPFEEQQFVREFGITKDEAITKIDQFVDKYIELSERLLASDPTKTAVFESDEFEIPYEIQRLENLFVEIEKYIPNSEALKRYEKYLTKN